MVAVFQFDACSVPLVRRLLGEGRLPNLAALEARGRWHDLETPATHFPAGAYVTLYSGTDVVDHGMYSFFQWAPDDQRVRWRESFRSPLSVWERLANADKRVLVIDAYESARPGALNGVALSGWQFVNVFSLHRWSYPQSAHSDLARVFGRPKRVEEVFGRPSLRSLLKLRALLLDATDRAVEGALHQMRSGSFDLVWIVFLSSHLGGHMLWDLSQIDTDDLDEGTRVTLEHALTDIYEQIDRGLGRLVDALPDDADVIVTAPSGMGENMIRVDMLPGMLNAVLSQNGGTAGGLQSRAEQFLWKLRAKVPTEARAKVSAAIHGPLTRELTMRLSSVGVDWSKTPAFLLPSDHFGHVRFNVRGRERDGIVDPGDADELAERIRAGLLSYRDPDGRPSVLTVDRPTDVFGEGKRSDLLPDLIVSWADRPSNGIDHLTSADFGELRRPGTGSGRSGAHLPEAWAVLAHGSSSPVSGGTPAVRDIVPTVCALLGVDARDLRGSPLLAPR